MDRLIALLPALLVGFAATQSPAPDVVVWKPAGLAASPPAGLTIAGKPQTVDCPYGPAMYFDGVDDGLFLAGNPLDGLTEFTVEAVFRPDGDGAKEQRFLHMGHAHGDRVLLETRVAGGQWWLDSFIQGGRGRPLIDPKLTHPADRWHHVAFVVHDGHLSNYIDGKLEIAAQIDFAPIRGGDTSIGVRLNRESWFKGAIYSIRISARALEPAQFTDVRPPAR